MALRRLFTKFFLFFFIFGGLIAPPVSQASTYSDIVSAESNLLYYWQMTEAAGSTSLAATVGSTAINITNATAGQSGQVGNAVSFNGSTSYGQTAATLDLTAYNKIAVEALLYVNSYDQTPRYSWEFSTNLTQVTTGFHYSVDGGSTGTAAATNVRHVGNGGTNSATYTRQSAGTWHHVVAIYNKGAASNEVIFYLDGVLQTPLSQPGNVNNTNNFGNHFLYLMSRAGSSLFVGGKMQHLAIYSDITAEDILQHAEASGVIPLTAGTLSSSTRTTTTIDLSWTDGTYGSGSITEQLQRSPEGANTWSNVSSGTNSPFTDTGLTENTTYDYRVAYTDGAATTVYSNTVSVATNRVYPAFTASEDLVKAGSYGRDAVSGGGNWGSGGGTSMHAIATAHDFRIRQDGAISRIRIFTKDKTHWTSFAVTVWRYDEVADAYDLVGTSNNILSSMVNNTTTTIDLSTPITGVQEGDFYGFQLTTSQATTGNLQSVAPNGLANASYYIVDQSPSSNDMDWATTGTDTNLVVPIETYMQAPQMVAIGDSLMSGEPAHRSFVDSENITDLDASLPAHLSELMNGITYQNMGMGGDWTSDIVARFTADVLDLHPRIVVINGGGNNDKVTEQDRTNFFADYTTILEAVQNDDDILAVYVIGLLPADIVSNANMQNRESYNDELQELIADYPKATYVDGFSYIGQFRSGGDAGNLWDIQDDYNADNVHLTSAGYEALAQAVADAIDVTKPLISNVSSTNTDGTYTTGQTVDIVVTFSEAVTSTGNITLTLNTTPTARTCDFTITSSTSATCTYTVQSGDTSSDLSVSGISGTINDRVGNTLVNFSPSTNLAANKNIVISATRRGSSYIGPTLPSPVPSENIPAEDTNTPPPDENDPDPDQTETPTETPTTPDTDVATPPTTGPGAVATPSVVRLIRTLAASTVYALSDNGLLYPFPNLATFLTYESDFTNVEIVSNDVIATTTVGQAVLPRAGTVLVKIPASPKVFVLAPGTAVDEPVLHWIPSEGIAASLFGPDWADYILDIGEDAYLRLPEGRDMTATDSVDTSELMRRMDIIETQNQL